MRQMINVDESRFWVVDSPPYAPFGWKGIVDEEAGGVIAFAPSAQAERIARALDNENGEDT